MLNDRDYMRYREAPFRESPRGRRETSFLFLLIILNVLMFVFQAFNRYEERGYDRAGRVVRIQRDRLIDRLALVSTEVREGQVYRVVTHMFLHGGFWHLLMNMWGLYLFGSLLEQRIGGNSFLSLYFISGLVGAGLWLLFNWGSSIPCVGASGAVFGIILATAMFFPDIQIMLLFPPIPMKLRTFAVVFGLLELFLQISKIGGGFNIAHIVHLGGFVGAYIYVRIKLKRYIVWDPLDIFRGKRKGLYDVHGDRAGWSFTRPEVTQKDLDRILDKISTEGVNSLSEEEMEVLRKAREEMKKRG